jgi:ABC-2 type transport system ATP-binding protein
MTVAQQLDFTASFYPNWDAALEKRLIHELELNSARKIVQLSQGDQQKLSIVLGVCHHPKLLLLDEPMSALDPIIRARFLDLILERLRDDGCTAVISSHLLGDVEKIIDWVVCLDAGELAVSAPFDELQESYAEWLVTASSGGLPEKYTEPFIISYEGGPRQARVCVSSADNGEASRSFAATYRAEVKSRSLNLEEMFPHLLKLRNGRTVK